MSTESSAVAEPLPIVTTELVMALAEQMAAASKAIFANLARIDREQLGSALLGDDPLCEALDDIRDHLETAIDYITGYADGPAADESDD